jgi:hypothetical protein
LRKSLVLLYNRIMKPTKESLGPIIIETLSLPIYEAANKIIEDGNLEYLTPEEVMNSIKSFRQKRKGLEMCCETLVAIYRRKSIEEDDVKLSDSLDSIGYAGILGGMQGPWGRNRP